MSAALAACKILRKMAEEGSDADEAAEMRDLADHFEMQAIGMTIRCALRRTNVQRLFHCVCLCLTVGVFTQCYSGGEERAKRLLVRVSRNWGKTTCLRLALEANCKSFVALSGVQVEPTSFVKNT